MALERHGSDHGVIVMGIKEVRISWARLYMEPVKEAGKDIDQAMQTITGIDQSAEAPENEADR